MTEATTFNPAASIPEASARMFALSAAQDAGTRGPKRSLVALAQSLGLDVDLAAVNAELGGQIAQALDADWHADVDYRDLQITLVGMNRLLRAATENLAALSHAATVSSNATAAQVLKAFSGFKPAQRKQEAVNRLSDLAGVERDTLGPGGKEHIWTLQDLARRLAPHLLDRKLTKHELAAALCADFGVPWIDTAGSTGASITLEGLNLLLAGAERRANVASSAWTTAEEEAAALVRVLRDGLPARWDGKDCIQWMRDNGSTQWRQMEWAGFYFEEKARELLNEAYPTPPVGGPRTRFGNTVFDYASPTRVWDAKAHTSKTTSVPSDGQPPRRASAGMWLNDSRAVRKCVEEQGLGFLIIDGLAGLDTLGTFRAWHKEYAESDGRPLSGYVASTGTSRPRKATWAPLHLQAIWIENMLELDAGIAAGWIFQKSQPHWGAAESRRKRNDKFQARPSLAADWQVASHSWEAPA
ncbi:hypothetical protein [Promicromonospora sp. NPDC050880]|uniref:hypothetical protein n=1 Tax=Promicromonospora sp. NPDC050880 TaxID=3364406 RepID=UPI0037AEBE7D